MPLRSPSHSPRAALVATALFALASAAPRDARATPFNPESAAWDGCSELVRLARAELGDTRVEVARALDWSALRKEDSLLVLHPERALSSASLGAFLAAGGRAALVDDFGAADRTLARWGIERVPPPAHPASALRRNPALAIARPAPDENDGASTHPTVADVNELVTNHPTALAHPSLAPVLVIPSLDGADGVVAMAGIVGRGRLFVMSDPSALTNQMLRYPGNRAFAAALPRYLGDATDGARPPGRLILLAGDFDESGSFEGAGPLAGAERLVRPLLALLGQVRREGARGPLAWSIAAAGVVAVAAWVLSIAGRTYVAPRPRWARGSARGEART